MIAFLNGTVAAKARASAQVDVGGVGYELLMSRTSLDALPAAGEDVHVITYLSVTDAGVALYGFSSTEEEQLFRSLIAVSGIGPKMALAALSTFSPPDLIAAVTAEDVKALSKIPGIGKKTASRMVLELKGALPSEGAAAACQDQEALITAALKNAADALSSMGFTKAEVEAALSGAEAGADEEALLQYALKRLG